METYDELKKLNKELSSSFIRQILSLFKDKEMYTVFKDYLTGMPKEDEKAIKDFLKSNVSKELEKKSKLFTVEPALNKFHYDVKQNPNFLVLFGTDYLLTYCLENPEYIDTIKTENKLTDIYYTNIPVPDFNTKKQKKKKINILDKNRFVGKYDEFVYLDDRTRVSLKRGTLQILDEDEESMETYYISLSYGSFMQFFIDYIKEIHDGRQVLLEDAQAVFRNLEYIILNIEDIYNKIRDESVMDDVLVDLLMAGFDIAYIFNSFDKNEVYIKELIKKIKYLKHQYQLDNLRNLILHRVTIDEFGEFSSNIKHGVIKKMMTQEQLIDTFKQVSNDKSKKYKLALSLSYLNNIQKENEFEEIFRLSGKKNYANFLRNIILNTDKFKGFYGEYKDTKKHEGLPKQVQRNADGKIMLTGTPHFLVDYNFYYSSSHTKLIFSNGQTMLIRKAPAKGEYSKLFKGVVKKELFAEALAKQMRISCTYHDLAEDEEGNEVMLASNFAGEDKEFVKGKDILGEYADQTDIKQILELTDRYLRKRKMDEESIRQVKVEFCKMVIFDRVINKVIKNNNNWGIIIEDTKAQLAPLYNNGLSLNITEGTDIDKIVEENKNTWKIGAKDDFEDLIEFVIVYPEIKATLMRFTQYKELKNIGKEILKDKQIRLDVKQYITIVEKNKEAIEKALLERKGRLKTEKEEPEPVGVGVLDDPQEEQIKLEETSVNEKKKDVDTEKKEEQIKEKQQKQKPTTRKH